MRKKLRFLGIAASVLIAAACAHADNKKLMTVQAAKTDAQRAILESIVGLKVKSQSRLRDMVADDFTIDAKTSGVVKDIEFADIVYDPDKDIAKVVARIKIGKVINIVGRRLNYGDTVIERVGFGTSTEANSGPLKAMRAAQIHAYQQLAEKLVGLHIDSKTTVENYILKDDDVKASVLAAIWGAQVSRFSWDPDGDAHVTMSLKANYMRDVLGQRFTGEQPEITVEGVGSATDSFGQTNPSTGGASAKIREESLGIPTGGKDTGGITAAGKP